MGPTTKLYAGQQHQPAELQTLRTKLQYITPSTAISSNKEYNRGPHGANAGALRRSGSWMCPPQKHFEVLPSLRPTAAPQFQHSSAPPWAPLCPRLDTDPHHHRAVELPPAQSTSGGGSSSSHHSSRTGYAVQCGYLGAQLPSGSQRDPCCWVWQPRSWWPKDCHL